MLGRVNVNRVVKQINQIETVPREQGNDVERAFLQSGARKNGRRRNFEPPFRRRVFFDFGALKFAAQSRDVISDFGLAFGQTRR